MDVEANGPRRSARDNGAAESEDLRKALDNPPATGYLPGSHPFPFLLRHCSFGLRLAVPTSTDSHWHGGFRLFKLGELFKQLLGLHLD